MKIDPYHHKDRYLEWKKEVFKTGISGIGEKNSKIILEYVNDMEIGANISSVSVKGSRGYCRLNSLRGKLIFFAKKFKELYDVDYILDIQESQLFQFFSDLNNGIIRRNDGKEYVSIDTISKVFKAFWHWHQKVSRKKGIEIPDITMDLDTKPKKPKWVYLTEDQIRKLCESAKYEYKVLMLFLFDTGIRAPTELVNVRVSDLYDNCKELHIRDEISKTFGRRIKLMLCSDLVKEYIMMNGLKSEDQLFPIKPATVNRYLQRHAEKVLGKDISEAGESFHKLTMYDFRHCACCYWLPRYKSESALKYRFGWKKSDKIHYYSELLGMKDTISEEDLLIDITKTEIEKRLLKAENEKEMMKERMKLMEDQMRKILTLVNQERVLVIGEN